jgi:chromate reductase, NAD(P)H dehydrogenase (quinone)
MRILAISGSLRRGSHNTRLLRHAAERAPEEVEIELYDDLRSIPPYDEDDDTDPAPAPVATLRQAIADADGILISTPEYNSSIPGALKNAIDWASRPRATTPLQNKPAAVIGATTGQFGAIWAQAEMRKVLASTGARVVDLDLPLAKAHEAFDEQDALTSPAHHGRLDEVIAALIEAVEERERSARPTALAA